MENNDGTIDFPPIKEMRDRLQVEGSEEIEALAWDLINASLLLASQLSDGDIEAGLQMLIDWLEGSGVVHEQLSGRWNYFEILNPDQKIVVRRRK